MNKFLLSIVLTMTLTMLSIQGIAQGQMNKDKKEAYVYEPDSKEIFETLRKLDSIYWHAYNTCDMKTQAAMFSDSLEFYHDWGGLSTSKQESLEGIEKNICGKVTRIEVPGTLEVYPIKDYGAAVMGIHRFVSKQDPHAQSGPGRYIVLWKNTNDTWQMKRIISLH